MFSCALVAEKGFAKNMRTLTVGLDVGSTTVKAVVVDPETKEILWDDYQRHHTKQAECVLEFMVQIGRSSPSSGPTRFAFS